MNISTREHALAVALAEILGNVTPVTNDPASVLSSVRKIAVAALSNQIPDRDGRSLVLLPPGYKAVPIEPTEAQLAALLGDSAHESEKLLLVADYTALINAAPVIPSICEPEKL
jgi:hypothetical protein